MYIKNIKDKFGKFQHAPSKINLDPKKEEEQLKLLYPNVRNLTRLNTGLQSKP